MNLPKIHSISKKILVALLGAFLSIFLLFHASANLCILRNDGGKWYNDFCDFMGTNYVVKAFEIVLFGALLLHQQDSTTQRLPQTTTLQDPYGLQAASVDGHFTFGRPVAAFHGLFFRQTRLD